MKQKDNKENIIRSELNIEKLWNIWQPKKSKEKLTKLVIERSSGSSKSKIEITSNSKYGPMTTETQKVLYALFKISEEQGHPHEVEFSIRKIARKLEKGWSRNVKESIELSLYQLKGTLFVMNNHFYDSDTKKTLESIEAFNILTKLKLAREENDGHVTTEECYCEFHELIYKNLKSNYSKPLLLDVVIEIGDDGIAQILYTHLDLILSETNPYKRRAEKLFKDLQLTGKQYKWLSYRKRTLEKIIKVLEGKRLSKGGVLHLSIELTVDQKDYNLVCERVEKTNTSKSSLKELTTELSILSQDEEGTLNPITSNQLLLEEEFVNLFFTVFKARRKKVTEKELSQAKELIDSHQLNLKECHHIIDYSLIAAQKTNYKPQYFGGILQYVEEAIAQYRNKGNGNGNTQTSSGDCSLCQFTDGYLYITYENGTTDRIGCPHNQEAIKNMGANNKFRLGL